MIFKFQPNSHQTPTKHLPGDAATVTDQIPWLISSDLELVVLVDEAAGGTPTKQVMTIAEVLCWITKTRGATEALMLDHNLEVMYKEIWLNVSFSCFFL